MKRRTMNNRTEVAPKLAQVRKVVLMTSNGWRCLICDLAGSSWKGEMWPQQAIPKRFYKLIKFYMDGVPYHHRSDSGRVSKGSLMHIKAKSTILWQYLSPFVVAHCVLVQGFTIRISIAMYIRTLESVLHGPTCQGNERLTAWILYLVPVHLVIVINVNRQAYLTTIKSV